MTRWLVWPAAALVGLVSIGMTNPAGTAAQETSERQAEQADPLERAKQLVHEGGYAEAAAILAELAEGRPEDGALLVLYGEVLVAAGQAEQAVEVLRRALETDPERVRLHFQLATAQSRLGRIDEALASFAREIELNEDPDVRFLSRLNRSILLKRRHRWSEAAGELEQALELQPGNSEAYGELASLQLNAGRPADAAATLERGASRGFRSAPLLFNVGARFYNDRGYEEAERLFREALEIDPEMAEAERSLAATLSQLGRAEEARRHLGRYLALRPDAPDAEELRKQVDGAER